MGVSNSLGVGLGRCRSNRDHGEPGSPLREILPWNRRSSCTALDAVAAIRSVCGVLHGGSLLLQTTGRPSSIEEWLFTAFGLAMAIALITTILLYYGEALAWLVFSVARQCGFLSAVAQIKKGERCKGYPLRRVEGARCEDRSLPLRIGPPWRLVAGPRIALPAARGHRAVRC